MRNNATWKEWWRPDRAIRLGGSNSPMGLIDRDGPKWIAPDRPDIDCPEWTCQTAARGPISGDDNAPQGRLWNGLIDPLIDQLKLDSLNPSRGSMGSINHRSPGGRYKALGAKGHREPIEP